MSQRPTFTVVIPTYNRADFIGRTLQSVFDQTHPAHEIIVVDDCSTDGTADLLRPLAEAGRVRYLRHEVNRERGASRNTGMEAATGDYLTLLDSDDLMYPTNLEDAARFARENPGLKCFHNLIELIDPEGRVVYRPQPPPLGDRLRAIAQGNFMSCVGDFLHRDLYRRHRFDPDRSLSSTEDWDFWLRVLAANEVGRIEKINNGVIHHGGRSLNNVNLPHLQAALERIVAKLYADPGLRSVYAPYLKSVEANYRLYLAIHANSGGAYGEALRYLRGAAARDPRVVLTRRFAGALRIALFRANGTRSVAADPA